jgi:cellulose biosynthesis protein BcsQ
MAITYSIMNKLSQKALENCCLTFSDASILLMPGTNTKNKETFERDIGNAVHRMLMDVDKYVDLVLIDSNSGEDKLSMSLMTTADLVVINLTQRRYVLEKFFLEYGEHFINNKRVFYIFGDYDDNSSYNINNCRKKYSRYITNSNSGVVPYCTKFMDAQNESNVMKFLQNGLLQRRNKDLRTWLSRALVNMKYGKYAQEETEYFFHRSLLCVGKMSGMMQLSVKKERKDGNVR